MHAREDDSDIPLKPLEAMLSIDLAHPNIIHTYKFYTRIRQVCCKLNNVTSALQQQYCDLNCPASLSVQAESKVAVVDLQKMSLDLQLGSSNAWT